MPERFCNSKLMQQKIMIMEPNKFDQSIKEKMEARTIVPSAEAWEKLEAMMPLVENQNGKLLGYISQQVLLDCLLYWYHFLSKF
jgi:hypothetical protein